MTGVVISGSGFSWKQVARRREAGWRLLCYFRWTPGLLRGLESGRGGGVGKGAKVSPAGELGTWRSFDCEGSQRSSSPSQVPCSWGSFPWGNQGIWYHLLA